MKKDGGKGADIRERAFEYACAIVSLHRRLYRAEPSLRDISRQSVRAGTAIGASLEEADAGHSKADFIAKCGIALKEARESRYWLRILHREYKKERVTIEKLGADTERRDPYDDRKEVPLMTIFNFQFSIFNYQCR